MFLGHIYSLLVAVVLHKLGTIFQVPHELLLALIPSASIGVMVLQKVPHPPAAACAFIFESYAHEHEQSLGGLAFIVLPGVLGSAYMLLVQYVVHLAANWLYAMHEARKARVEVDAKPPDMV